MGARFVVALFAAAFLAGPGSAAEIRWLIEYDGAEPPAESAWSARGKPNAAAGQGGLHLKDDSDAEDGFYQATWKADPDQEIVVEATVKVGKTTGVFTKTRPNSVSVWPWRDGAPVSLFVSDGRRQEGLVFYTDKVTTFTDRFALLDTAKEFHTYRLVIRGNDMSVAVDGEVKIKGQGAFWKPAPERVPFLRFGSTSRKATGDAVWKSVRLGVRQPAGPAPADPIQVTMSPPWEIPRPDLKTKPTRPYVYNIGQGKLLMSVAQGPDAIYEPYGVMLSADEGQTWAPVRGLDHTEFAPLAMRRLKDGTVLGVSRWTWLEKDRSHRGRVVRWEADLSKFSMIESRIDLPREYQSDKVTITCERQLFEEADGSLLMTGYTRTGPDTPEGRGVGRRYSHLLRSTDGGKTWTHVAVIGAGGEPAVVKTGPGRLTALLRAGPFKGYRQTFSEDRGKTWGKAVTLEEGSVSPDLFLMEGGLLACSYGRPASCLMFSPDAGKTWTSHHVVSDRTGFNYTAVVEVKPGRLLYVHDAGGLRALTIDVDQAGGSGPARAGERKPEKPAESPSKARTVRVTATIGKALTPSRVITYKTVEQGRLPLTLHVFNPTGWKATDRRPVLVTFHGGGWAAGEPSTQYYMADRLAKYGWVGISVKYRLTNKLHPGVTPFDAVKDARSAVRYVRAHAAELGIDPDRLVTNGGSAGGHLAAATALFDDVNDPADDLTVSPTPQLMILFYPVIDTGPKGYGHALLGKGWKTLSPVDRVVARLPPTLLLHGERDTVTPFAGAELYHERMRAAGNDCELIRGKGGHGYFTYQQGPLEEAMAQVDRWLKSHGYPVNP